ncbi:MAG: glycosyltransferase family 4 protein [Geminicoccaceae bacterium]
MAPIERLAFIGNSLPRRCGIATFTTDLQQAVAGAASRVATRIVALNDDGDGYDYPASVLAEIEEGRLDDYALAAGILNAGRFDVVSLQHEFGIFGGEAGEHVLALLRRLTMPVVTTLHTVLESPSPEQHRVMRQVIEASARIVVMAEKARDLLRAGYGLAADRIEVIPHGIPDVPFVEPDSAKAALGFGDRPIILTFGLLSPNKGIEVMIDALPSILEQCPRALYVVLGATHPNLVRQEGETYRLGLVERARALGFEGSVLLLDRFVDQPTLLEHIAACDVYVTPYLSEAQMTSGTLAYSFGMGKAVVSTPYWHAQELLADGRGVLVPFGDAAALGREIGSLLSDETRRLAMRRRAYAASRAMTWEQTAERYLSVFEGARRHGRFKVVARAQGLPGRDALPEPRLDHLHAMCDDTGLYQHAVYSVPDRAHGYCVDDNARALLLSCSLAATGGPRLSEPMTARFAAFVQHAWNPAASRFRNFMSFDRRWLEEAGSEDSHGRTLWALGQCAGHDAGNVRRRWAADLLLEALQPVEGFRSPRAWAFTLLGLDAYCATRHADARAGRMRQRLAGRLMALLTATEKADWVWFEPGLSYDNARLPQALLLTGMATEDREMVHAGLRSLRWLCGVQTSPAGLFRPVGSEGFGEQGRPPRPFDQQPIEAAATIAACLAAWRAEPDAFWRAEAARAFAWFLGANDLAEPLADIETGSCRDGLHRDRPNENRGGESVLAYLTGLCDMRRLMGLTGAQERQAVERRSLEARVS